MLRIAEQSDSLAPSAPAMRFAAAGVTRTSRPHDSPSRQPWALRGKQAWSGQAIWSKACKPWRAWLR
jgi:hypothetical protein